MAHLSQEYVQHLYETFGELKVLDDVIRHRAADELSLPIIGYPRHERSVDDYELFTARQLDQFIDAAVKYFMSNGFCPNGRQTVALLAPSDMDYVVSFFALSRLGYTVLTLSLRITSLAIINLLQKTGCSTIVHGSLPQIESTLRTVGRDYSINPVGAPTRSHYDRPLSGESFFVREFDREEENRRIAWIIHSSGSTGLPKPVKVSHRALLTHPTQGSGLHNFNPLPWYHIYGVSTSLQAMWMRKTAYLYNAARPLTAENLVLAMEAIRPEAVHTVPYVLGLLAENQRGIEALKTCHVVTAAGARTPDELGDRLVRAGINLGIVYGATEVGLTGDSMRRANGDDSWNYIRLYANIRQYVHMAPAGDGLYEFVYLKGHPALSSLEVTDDPLPGSWHSKDIFTPHPSIPDLWKYVTRIDDRVTLINGEKVLPLPIEGRMREDRLVREAAVVGIDRPIPGLLVFRAVDADSMSTEAYLDAIWPSAAEANSRAEAFSQITREMVRVLSSDTTYPQTDKGSIIRAQLYAKFATEIEDMYAQSNNIKEGGLKFNLSALENYIMRVFQDTIGVSLPSLESDFFSSGVDSLKAIQMRQQIQNKIFLNGKILSANIIYEKANAKVLAQYLYVLGKGEGIQHDGDGDGDGDGDDDDDDDDQSSLMKQMIDKYSKFRKHQHTKSANHERGQVVMLTGATGSIGAHTLAQLLTNERLEKIYCLVRGTDPLQRIFDSLTERRLQLSPSQKAKIFAFVGDLSKENLGLDEAFFARLKVEVSLVVHIAWPVNFNIALQSFEPWVAGLHNLLQFSLSVNRPEPAQVIFCSSISTALNTPTPASIPNARVERFDHVATTGYARSKFVGEHVVCNAARAGARSYVFRIGQVVGDTLKGVWNDKEFLPMLIRSALTLKTLPILQDSCSWLPVDTLAKGIVELSETLERSGRRHVEKEEEKNDDDTSIFYNLVNPHVFSWDDLLAELHTSGLEFTPVPFHDWLQMLQKSAERGDELRNPVVKLIDYIEQTYGDSDGNETTTITTNLKKRRRKGKGSGSLTFDSGPAQRDSVAIRSAPDVAKSGLVRKFLVVWLQRWIQESY